MRYIILFQDKSYKDIFRWEHYVAEDKQELGQTMFNLGQSENVHRVSVFELGKQV